MRASGTYSAADLASGDFDGANRWTHPVVVQHPETQKPTLYINPGFTSHLDGFERSESDALLSYLYQHCQRAEFVYRHQWKPNDLLIWDNRCTMHCAVSDYTADRYLHRATVIAEPPVRYQTNEG